MRDTRRDVDQTRARSPLCGKQNLGGRVVSANRLDVGGVDPTLLAVRATHRYQRDASRAQVADCPINLVNGVLYLQLVAVDEDHHRFDLPCHDSDPTRGKRLSEVIPPLSSVVGCLWVL